MPWLKDIRNRFFKPSFLQANWGNSSPYQHLRGAGSISERRTHELVGLIKGVMADGNIKQSEGEFLLQWLEANKDSLNQWPALAIYPQLKSALSDGNLDNAEKEELRALLAAAIPGDPTTAHARSLIDIPFTQPIPHIQFANRLFCFTGHLQTGSRSWCASQIVARGGTATSKIDRKLHYLIVGDIGADRFPARQGRKIVRAIRQIEVGTNIVILRERHWFEQLMRDQA